MAEEKNYETKIKKFLTDHNSWFVKYWSGKSYTGQKFTKDGIPDILCCCNGRFIGIEVKAEKGHPSELQLYNLRKIDEAGGYAILLYPKDWVLFQNFILCVSCSDWTNASLNYDLLKRKWENYGNENS